MQTPALLLPILLLCLLIPFPPSHGADPLGCRCNKDKNATQTTSANIARVLDALAKKVSKEGSGTASSSGVTGERVHGLAQCRGDVSAADCQTCVADAARQLPELCRGQADAQIWFDYCFVRYDTTDFVRQLQAGFWIYYISTDNVSEDAAEQQRFAREREKLMSDVQAQALVRTNRGLGKGQVKFTDSVTIYALGQCMRDLPPELCAQCIASFVLSFPEFCTHRKGCRAYMGSCYVRHETYPFFFPLSSHANVTTPGNYTRIRGY